ncbi:MAG TPA: DUF2892 domain-containing protein [Pedobacter sp.]|jgi:uncharacterized membrane protein
MENSVVNTISDTLSNSSQESSNSNVGQTERMISVGAGAFIALKGITNLFSHPLLALTELGVGGALLHRGLTGYCAIKEKLDEQQLNSNLNSVEAVPVTAMPAESY